MKNRGNNFLNKKIPTLIGGLLLIISVISLTWINTNTAIFGSKAAGDNTPKQVQISNISDSAFTVSYITDERNLGTITYGNDQKLGKISLDDRDKQSGIPSAFRIHHITVQNLEPSTKYYFSIISNNTTFTNNDQSYEVVTASRLTTNPSNQSPVVGKVTLDDATIPAEAIAYITSEDSQLLSVLLKPDGSYLLPLNTIRKTDLSAFVNLNQSSILHLKIISPTMQSTISLLVSQINPVPFIILSKDYDFTISNLPLFTNRAASSSGQASGSAQKVVFPTLAESTSASGLAILSPNTGEKLKDSQPMFTGKALLGNDVEIIIESQTPIDITIKSDSNGNWEYRPDTPLAPGQHTISIKTPDASGILQTVSRSFTVYAAGSLFADPTTTPPPFNLPSLAPTVVPTLIPVTPTASPTILPTIAPTIPAPTITPTFISSSSSSLTITPANKAKPPLPKTGSSSLISGFIITLSIVLSGVILFFFTRGGSAL